MLGKPLAALVLTLACTVAAAGPVSAGPYDAGLSEPERDSFYPAHSNPAVDVLHYDLDLTWQATRKRLVGDATLTIRPTADASRFRLELGEPLTVTKLDVDGVPATHTRKGKNLLVQHAVTADEEITVDIGYAGKPKQVAAPVTRGDIPGLGWKTLDDGRVWAMQEPWGAYTWYPSNDTPSDKALYDVRIDAPAGMVGVSNGELTDRTETPSGRTVTTFHNTDPMASYLVTVAIGPYEMVEQTGPHGLPLTYWVPPGLSDRKMAPLLDSPNIIAWLESQLGPYPFDRAGAVVVPAESAMETQTMVTMGTRMYSYGNRYFNEVLAHEYAHAWYGDTVTPSQWRDLWMNEGFAMYLEGRYSVHKGWNTWRNWKRAFSAEDQLYRREYGPPGAYDKSSFASINVYYCTARMLVRLRSMLGASAFGDVLEAWPQERRNTNSSRRDYVRWIEAKTGEELSGFFKAWLNDTKSPK